MNSNITASIVLYNTDPVRLEKLLNVWSASEQTGELFLIDNSPEECQHFKNKTPRKVKYIFNNKNVGYGAGHNIAIRQVLNTGKYHVVLNPDIDMEEGVIEKLLGFMEQNPGIGHVMPKVLYPDGSIQYVCKLVPTPFDLFVRRFMPASLFPKSADTFCLKFTGYNKTMDVPYLSGCFMFLRLEALKEVGLFDERFFMYPEDIDLTRRIHKKFRTVFYPEATVFHEHGAGSYRSGKLLWIHITNLVKYFNKWGWLFDKERNTINFNVLKQLRQDA